MEVTMMTAFFIIFVVVCVLLLGLVMLSTVYVVRQQSVAIIERFGKYQKTANSGIHLRMPFGIDSIAARIQLRLLQSDIVVETKTKDNVFVMLNVATQYRVNEQSVTDAYYKLTRPESQIKSYIEDALRSSVPKLTLDELFEKKDEIAKAYFEQRPEDYFFTTELLSYEPSTNKWRNEGRVPFSGRAGAAFTIQGNDLVVVNGEIKPGLRTAETHSGKFTAKGVEWKNLPDLPAPKGQSQDGLAGAMAGYSHGHYLVTGGANFPGSVKQFKEGMLHAHKGLSKAWHKDIYTLNNGKWKIVGELPAGIGYGVAVSYDNKVLLIGGETEGGKALTSVQTMSYDGKQLKVE